MVALNPLRPVGREKKELTLQSSSPESMISRDGLKIITCFDNRAGQYELIRVDDGRVHYSFTNWQGKTVDAIMPLIMWQKIAARAGQS
jgi:hypothetical protein